MFLVSVKSPTMAGLRDKLVELLAALDVNSKTEIVYKSSATLATFPEDSAEDLGYNETEEEVVPAPPAIVENLPKIPEPPVTLAVPPSIPSVPAYLPPATPVPAAQSLSGEVDADGVQWDARIHSSSKAKNKDGTWRTRRGVDDSVLNAVKAETPKVATPAYVPPVGIVPAVPAIPNAPVSAPVVAAIPQAPIAAPVQATPPPQVYENIQTPPPSVQKPAHTLETFGNKIIETFVALLGSKQIDQAYIESLKDYFKVKEIWDVRENPAQLQTLFENFVAAGLITRIG